MGKFEEEYARLNSAQRRAVDTIEGPMLVIAGPGSGKTQLLGMRVANIIRQTDTPPNNILCLTFTDNAARNMRERLESIIGQAAYHVNIHTFHSFGVDIIQQNPDFFAGRQLIQQIDELGSYELLKDIFEDLPHTNPLSIKIGHEYVMLHDTLSFIGWLKQNALTPQEFLAIINANHIIMEELAPLLKQTFSAPTSPKNVKNYMTLLDNLKKHNLDSLYGGFKAYSAVAAVELEQAIEATNKTGRYAPHITSWRNKWCEKNAKGEHVFKDAGRSLRKMRAVAQVYQELVTRMSALGLFDFDDMIVESVHALETSSELRANMQERYLYILVDEFQDTNKAQLRMLMALGDNPVFESRPNLMAVGDDDQAIYAFQGAEVSNMAVFASLYKQPALITLHENYRSTAAILQTSFAVAEQIKGRLDSLLPSAHKQLRANQSENGGHVEQVVLPSELSQYAWIASHIRSLLDQGTLPEDIAVLAPRHRYLERLIPYLAKQHIPVAYERRENILEAPIVAQLIAMTKLVTAIASNEQTSIDVLLAEVIAYDFWDITSETLLDISITCFTKHVHWLPTLLAHKDHTVSSIARWFIDLARHASTEPLEYILDSLLGIVPSSNDSDIDEIAPKPKRHRTQFISPMRDYYFSEDRYEQATDNYLALLGQLSTLRQRLRAWKPHKMLYAQDLVNFANLHDEAHIKIIDTNPHTQTTNAVQVMTAYKAKGLEFGVVFIINAQDEVWGPTTRQPAKRISLPKNLPLAPLGDNDDDKLRLLFVAMSRAKHSLILTSYSFDLSNRLSPGLSFIGGNTTASVAIDKHLTPRFIHKPATAEAVEILTTDWAYRFRQIIADKPTLFEPILATYKLSVTHLNNFIDIVNNGPNYFFTHNLLRFPEALTPAAAYGDAIHRTLQWFHTTYRQSSKPPAMKTVQDYFSDMLARKHLRSVDFKRLNDRGKDALARYMEAKASTWQLDDLVERGFNNEGVVIGDARLSGKIDKLHLTKVRSAHVIDFKTGKPASSWQGHDEIEKIKLHKYKQQLLFYKLLVEQSASFAGKTIVDQGSLEFIEADADGNLVDNLVLIYTPADLQRFRELIGKVWQHIMTLTMPATDGYPKTLKGILAFEDDLLRDKI